MEESKIRWLEIGAAVIFVALIILVSIIVTRSGSYSQKTTITNSYNTYNYNINVNSAGYVPSYQNTRYVVDSSGHSPVYTEKRYLDYSSWSDYQVMHSVLGTPIANYNIYIENEENIGGYFKVTYYFDNYDGASDSASEIYYIGPHEQQKVVYKDVSPSEYKHEGWHYSVDSMTEMPANAYQY